MPISNYNHKQIRHTRSLSQKRLRIQNENKVSFGGLIHVVLAKKRFSEIHKLNVDARTGTSNTERTPLLTPLLLNTESTKNKDLLNQTGVQGHDGKPKYLHTDWQNGQQHNYFIKGKKIFLGNHYTENASQKMKTAIGQSSHTDAMLYGVDKDIADMGSTPPMIIDGLDDIAQMIIPNFPSALQEPALGIVSMGLLIPSVLGAKGMYEEYTEIKEMINGNNDPETIKAELHKLCGKLIDAVRQGPMHPALLDSSSEQQNHEIADILHDHLNFSEGVSDSFNEKLEGWRATMRKIGALGGTISMAAVSAEMRLGSIKGIGLFAGLLAGNSNVISAGKSTLDAAIALFSSAISHKNTANITQALQAIKNLQSIPTALLSADLLIDIVFAPLSQATMTAWATQEIIGGAHDRKQLSATKNALEKLPEFMMDASMKAHVKQAIETLSKASDWNRTLVGVGMTAGQVFMMLSTLAKLGMACDHLKQIGSPLDLKSLMVAYEAIGENGIAGVGPAPIVAALGAGVALTLGSVVQKFVMGGVSFLNINGIMDRIATHNGSESIEKHINKVLPGLLANLSRSPSDARANLMLEEVLPRHVFLALQREVNYRSKLHGQLAYALKVLDNHSTAQSPDRCLTTLEQKAYEHAKADASINYENQADRLHLLAGLTKPDHENFHSDTLSESDLESGLAVMHDAAPSALSSMAEILNSSRNIMDEVKKMLLKHDFQALSLQQHLQTVPLKERREPRDNPVIEWANRAWHFLVPEIQFFTDEAEATELTDEDMKPQNWREVNASSLTDEATIAILSEHPDLLNKAEGIAFELAHDNNIKMERQATHGLILMTRYIAAQSATPLS